MPQAYAISSACITATLYILHDYIDWTGRRCACYEQQTDVLFTMCNLFMELVTHVI